MSATVLRGDALALPLADETVDLVVTSPPYFALRSYTDGGQHCDGQLGSEPTPAEYVDALLAATGEMVRVLKPSGSIWVNLGDKYSGAQAQNFGGQSRAGDAAKVWAQTDPCRTGIPNKSLMGIPWRYAIACIDQLGLILRAEVIWCLSGGARVYARTPTGDRPIMLRDLVRSYRPENIQLWNGQQWTQVQGWNCTPNDDAALELELRSGERIGCTPSHQWPTDRGLLRADEIRVGDVITTTRLPARGLPRFPSALPDDDIGWLIGLYIAEGSRSETTIQFAGHIREDARHERLVRIAEAYDGTSAVYQTSENGVTCNLRGSVLIGIINRYVSEGTAKTKRLRHAAWQRSDTFLAAVVEGYLSGDGHYDAKNDRWRLGFTANDEWAADLRTLAARLGTVLRLRRADHSMSGRTFPGWRGEWRWTRSAHHNAKQDGEVVAIRRSRARDFYDLGVADEPHLFALASGVLTHNSKPNGLPESVTDRVRRSHETWFHMTRQGRYYAAVDEIREEHSAHTLRYEANGAGVKYRTEVVAARAAAQGGGGGHPAHSAHPLGKLPGSVWTVPTEPLTVPAELGVDHFAAFPTEWPRRIIAGWSPPAVCVECGQGRRPDINRGSVPDPDPRAGKIRSILHDGAPAGGHGRVRTRTTYTPIGYVCACTPYTDHPGTGGEIVGFEPDGDGYRVATRRREYHHDRWTPAPTRPAVVLDPFSGTGTVPLVADVMGRHGIGVDLSADYCRLAAWRTTDPGQRARAAQVPKPPPVIDGQLSLEGMP